MSISRKLLGGNQAKVKVVGRATPTHHKRNKQQGLAAGQVWDAAMPPTALQSRPRPVPLLLPPLLPLLLAMLAARWPPLLLAWH